MKAIKIAQLQPRTVAPTATVREALTLLGSENGCAVGVVRDRRLVGTLSHKDILTRVLSSGFDLESTTVSDVMTTPACSVGPEVEMEEAMSLMLDLRQCYLPVVDSDGELKAWLAICDLYEDHVDDLVRQLDSMTAYAGADGAGGD